MTGTTLLVQDTAVNNKGPGAAFLSSSFSGHHTAQCNLVVSKWLLPLSLLLLLFIFFCCLSPPLPVHHHCHHLSDIHPSLVSILLSLVFLFLMVSLFLSLIFSLNLSPLLALVFTLTMLPMLGGYLSPSNLWFSLCSVSLPSHMQYHITLPHLFLNFHVFQNFCLFCLCLFSLALWHLFCLPFCLHHSIPTYLISSCLLVVIHLSICVAAFICLCSLPIFLCPHLSVPISVFICSLP